MTFDEANKIVESFYEDPELEYWMPDSKVYEIIEGLREEYESTIEMTKTDKDVLLCYLENYSFYAFIETIHRSKNNTFGIPANKEFENLSDEDLMQAWLHPESIEEVE